MSLTPSGGPVSLEFDPMVINDFYCLLKQLLVPERTVHTLLSLYLYCASKGEESRLYDPKLHAFYHCNQSKHTVVYL